VERETVELEAVMVADGKARPPRLHHPAFIIATWFGAGLLPLAPGSWGSLAALPFAWLIAWLFGARALLIAAAVLFLLGWWAADRVTRASGISDAPHIVVDEVVGQWITLAVAPRDGVAYLAGFLLFRFFDIVKPWPARWAESRLAGGLGIMADDVIAAFFALAALALFLIIIGKPLG
jgi:phosphatidylglycerophosphatase A